MIRTQAAVLFARQPVWDPPVFPLCGPFPQETSRTCVSGGGEEEEGVGVEGWGIHLLPFKPTRHDTSTRFQHRRVVDSTSQWISPPDLISWTFPDRLLHWLSSIDPFVWIWDGGLSEGSGQMGIFFSVLKKMATPSGLAYITLWKSRVSPTKR